MPTKAEGIAEDGTDFPLLRLVERKVDAWVEFWVVSEVVDGRWDELVLDGKDASDGLNGPSSAEQVARH